jgi:hypothetical protein
MEITQFSSEELNEFLSVNANVYNAFAWVNVFVPVRVCLVLVGLTAAFYSVRFLITGFRNIWGIIK